MTQFINSTEIIRGRETSMIAKGEKNDCTVRSIATACDVDYDTAHSFTASEFKRERRMGAPTSNIVSTFAKGEIKVGHKEFKVDVLPKDRITNLYKLHGELIFREKTVKSFMKDFPKGTYVVLVSKHMFTVKDGVLIDNKNEQFRPTRKVKHAFRVTLKDGQLALFN